MSVSEGIQVFDETRKIECASGVAAYLAVVYTSTENGCDLPGGANASGCIGITLEAQATQNKAVAVRRQGLCYATIAGVCSVGDRLVINGTAGKLKAGETTGTTIQWVVARAEQDATDGDVIWVTVQEPYPYRPALT